MVRFLLKPSFIKISFTWSWALQVEKYHLLYWQLWGFLSNSFLCFGFFLDLLTYSSTQTKISYLKPLEISHINIIQDQIKDNTKKMHQPHKALKDKQTKDLSYLSQNPWNYGGKEDKSNS